MTISVIGNGGVKDKDLAPPLKQVSPSGFCDRLAKNVSKCIQNLGIGALASSIGTPVASGAAYLAEKVGVISKVGSSTSNLKEIADNMIKMGLRLDGDAIANAACPLQEFVTQFNRVVLPEFQTTVFAEKVKTAWAGGFTIPITEELIFRGLVQDVLLTRLPKYIIKKIAPGQESLLDSTTAKIIRVALTSALFSSAHIVNIGVLPGSYVSMQLVATFVMGIYLGALKESKAGLLGSIGAHISNNIMALIPNLMQC